MPWKDKTVENLRQEFIIAVQSNQNFSAVCREFNITRKTGYKWLERSQNNESLSNKSRAPLTIANRTPKEIEELIVLLRIQNPGWGAKKLKQVLENQNFVLPSAKTVNNILNRYGCISKEESLKHKPFVRFEKENCNDMWQTDFKGEFRMLDGNYCYPLNIFDDHSRYALVVHPVTSTANIVIPTFQEAFRRYGLPNSVLSDNGAQFAGFRQGFTQFEKWLMEHDILPIHGRIKHPQTQGKIERFHRTMKQELLKYRTPEDIEDAIRLLGEWQVKYNTVRPHEALGLRCPSEVYQASSRVYDETPKEYIYSGQYHVIKVNTWGYVRFDRWQVFLSETMAGEYIEFRPNPCRDSFNACFRNFVIAEFDSITGKLIHRKISRL